MKIIDNLYLGNYKASQSTTTLKTYNIKYILCVGVEMYPFFPDNYQYMKIVIFDSEDEDILLNFNQTYKYIKPIN